MTYLNRDFWLSTTLDTKLVGSVRAPVSRRIRNSFQSRYLCWMLRGGMSGLPCVAHQPTGCTSSEHRSTQKSLELSSTNPSKRSLALNPVRGVWIFTLIFHYEARTLLLKGQQRTQSLLEPNNSIRSSTWYGNDCGHPISILGHPLIPARHLHLHPSAHLVPTLSHGSL